MYGKGNKIDLCRNARIKIMLRIIKSLKLTNKKILDIGCYDGTLLSMLPKGNFLFGCDANKYAVKEAKKKSIKTKNFYFDDAHSFPYESRFFDLIIAGEIIEHIYDTDFFLKDIYRLLKPSGYFLISTPNIASLGRRLLLLFGKNPLIETSPNEKNSSGHIRYFTFHSLESMLKKNNFNPILKCSDVVNFTNDGQYSTQVLPKLLPLLGQTIIYLCQKRRY